MESGSLEQWNGVLRKDNQSGVVMQVGSLVRLWWYGKAGLGIIAKWSGNRSKKCTVLYNGQLLEWNKDHLLEIV